MSSGFYKKQIAEGKGFLVFAIIIAILIRCIHFFKFEGQTLQIENGGPLWLPFASFFQNPLYSLLCSTLFTLIIAFLINLVNTQYALIRTKTLLPMGLVIILFSFLPNQLIMSPAYIGTVAMLMSLNALFSTHGEEYNQTIVFKASFYLALGALFSPLLLFYLPVLWICFIRIRSFGFKAFLASLFSVIVLYVPVFSFFFFIEKSINIPIEPLISYLSSNDWSLMPVLSYELLDYITLGVVAILVTSILLNNSVNGFKDKIKIRIFLAVLSIICIFSILCVLLLNTNSFLPLYLALATGSLLIAHLFALTSSKLMPYTFYILLIFICIIGFLH